MKDINSHENQDSLEKTLWKNYYEAQDFYKKCIDEELYNDAAKVELAMIRMESVMESFYLAPWNYKSKNLIKEARSYL